MCVVVWSLPLLARGHANIAAGQAAVATAASHFATLDDASQEIYFTCTPSRMGRPIEISAGSWAETLPLFSVIEVRKRSKRDSSTRAVREQVGVLLSGPMQQRPAPTEGAQSNLTPGILLAWALEAYCCYRLYQGLSGRGYL